MTVAVQPVRGSRRSKKGEPAWELAKYFPAQGSWNENEFLLLEEHSEYGRFMELSDGFLEFRAMPTLPHERILKVLFRALTAWNERARAGEAFMSGAKTKLGEDRIRVPDILFAFDGRASTENYFIGADLVMEVVSRSSSDRARDLRKKRSEYEQAGVREYWIIDPEKKRIVGPKLEKSGKNYGVQGEFKSGEQASSALLKGFSVDVAEALKGAAR